MNWHHGALITLVIGVFLFNHRTSVIKELGDREELFTLSSEEITILTHKVDSVYSNAKDKIATGEYTALDWQRDLFWLKNNVLINPTSRSFEFFSQDFFKKAFEAREFIEKNYYDKQSRGRTNFIFHQEVDRAQDQVLRENHARDIDWSRGG